MLKARCKIALGKVTDQTDECGVNDGYDVRSSAVTKTCDMNSTATHKPLSSKRIFPQVQHHRPPSAAAAIVDHFRRQNIHQ